VAEIAGKPADTLQTKTWTFGSSTCRIQLLKKDWSALLSYLEPSSHLSVAKALDIRKQCLSTIQYRDSQDFRLSSKQLRHRVADMRLQEDGLLLPFGSDRRAFALPNPYV
jgi:hypothetical protein